MARALFILLLLHIAALSILWVGWPPTEWWANSDYGHYYPSALRLLQGENPYRGELVDLLTPLGFRSDAVEIRATNPPALILFTIPFTAFPPAISFWIWNTLQLTVFFLGVSAFVKQATPTAKPSSLLLVTLALICSAPFVSHLRHGQTQLLVVGVCLFGISYLRTRPRLAGFLLGFAASLKLFTLPLIVLTLRTSHRVQTLAWFAFGFLLLPGITELLTEEHLYLYYLSETVPFVTELALSISQEVSLVFLVFYSLAISFPQELSAEELRSLYGPIARAFSLLLLLGTVAINFFSTRAEPKPLQSGAILLTACVLFTPVAWPHYMVALFPLFLLLWFHFSETNNSRGKIAVIVLYTFAATSFGCVSSEKISVVWFTAAWGPAVMLTLLALGLRVKLKEGPVVCLKAGNSTT